jgi:NADH-quinone oxidoreductase subunit L
VLEHIWLIPLLPAIGALIQLLFGRKLKNAAVSLISVGLPGISFVWAVGCFFGLLGQPAHTLPPTTLYTWLPAGAFHLTNGTIGDLSVHVGFLLDPLSAVMLLVVTGVGFLIHIYSIGYMGHEGGYYRFFGYLNLFMFSMLVLILADNYLMMFVGWEGVGLCSYLLIGFYFQRKSAGDAGKKAFIVNRIGDAGFLLGVMLMTVTFGTLNFAEITDAAHKMGESGHPPVAVLTAICILLFIGATGKSAQIPLYIWLPDAMEGPTPVSALIHAATMVTAGVYMVARSNALFVLAPTALEIVAVIGGATAIWAASIGLVQNDIKKVLAYSTISQLGYMFLACGVGAFAAGIFHVMTHAFFKALLFLGAGSVIHAMSGEQDMRKMGGLWNKIPTTARTLFIAAVAISGIPPLAGFVSKDKILGEAYGSHPALWAVGWITAGLTAFYMFRLIIMTFFGTSRVDHEVEHHIHESPRTMLGPLVVLAGLSIVGGWIGWPTSLGGGDWFGKFLEPVFENHLASQAAEASSTPEYLLMVLSIAIAAVGIYVAYLMYQKRPELSDRAAAAAGPLHQILLNKYYVDELYDALFVNRTKNLGNGLAAFDMAIVDGGVNGVGWLTRMTATLSRLWDTWVIDGLVNVAAFTVKLVSYPVRMVQTGLVQSYALLIVLGVLIFMAYYLIAGQAPSLHGVLLS